MKGRVAVLRAYGGEFELREYPVPEVEPGAILVQADPGGGVRLRPAHLARRDEGDLRRAAQGPHLRPRDVRARRAPRRGRHHRLDGPAAARGRPRDLLLLLPLRPLSRCVSTTRWAAVRARSGPTGWRARAPYFNNAYGDYYYLRPGHFVFKMPDEISDDIATPINCALSQVLYGLRKAGLPRRALGGDAGGGRPRPQRGGGGARHGRGPHHRDRPARRAARARPSRSAPTTR